MKVTREELRSVVSEVLDEMLEEGRYGRYYGKAGRDPAMDYGRGRRSPHRLDREEYEYNVKSPALILASRSSLSIASMASS